MKELQEEHPKAETSKDFVFEAICGLLRPYNQAGGPLLPTTKISSELDIDSVGIMDVIMEIEEKFDIDIPVNLLSDVESVGDLAEIVSTRIAGK